MSSSKRFSGDGTPVATCRGVPRSTEARLATHYLKIQFITQLSTKTRVPLFHDWSLFNLRAKHNPTRKRRSVSRHGLRYEPCRRMVFPTTFSSYVVTYELHRLQRRSTYILLFVIVFESDVMTI